MKSRSTKKPDKPKRNGKLLATVVDASEAAYAALSTPDRPVTPALVRLEPQVTRQLIALGTALMREVQVRDKTILPLGIGADVERSWPHMLKLSDLPEAQTISNLYLSLPLEQARAVPMEAFCYASRISPMRVLEMVTGVLVRQGATAATLLTAVWHPSVVRRTIEAALDDSHADRQDLHKAVGFLPTPKGSQTIVNVTQATAVAPPPAIVPLPSPESTITMLAGAFNEARGLPAPVPVDVVDAETEAVEE